MQARLDEYAGHHTTLGNEVCHFVGIPLIIAGAADLLGLWRIATWFGRAVTPTELVLAAVTAFYLLEARVLGLITALIMVTIAELSRSVPWWLGLTLFALGWVVQFIGHARFERRSPAFFTNVLHLLVGPAWLVDRTLRRA